MGEYGSDDPDDPTGEGETYDYYNDPEQRSHVGYRQNAAPVFRQNLPPPDYHTRPGMYGGAIKDALERNAIAEKEAQIAASEAQIAETAARIDRQIDRENDARDMGPNTPKDINIYDPDTNGIINQWVAEKAAKDKARQDAADAYGTEWEMGTDAYASRQFYNPELREQMPLPQNAVPGGTDMGFGYNPQDFNKGKPTGSSGGGGGGDDDDGGIINTILGIPKAIGHFFTKTPIGQTITNAGLQAGAFMGGGPAGTIALNTALTQVDKNNPTYGFTGLNRGQAIGNVIGGPMFGKFGPTIKGLGTGLVSEMLSTPGNKGLPDVSGNMERLAEKFNDANWTNEGRAVGKFFTDGADKLGALVGKEEPGRNLTQMIDWTDKSAANTFGLGDLTGRYTGMTRKKKK